MEKVEILLGEDEAILALRPGSIGRVDNVSATQIGTKHGKLFAFFSETELTISLDTVDTITLKAPFESARKEFREVFRPFKFQQLRVLCNLEPLFDGTVIDIAPSLDPAAKTVTVTGYSKPGVLHDCNADVLKGAHKLEFKNCDLKTIAEQLCEPFGIEVEFRDFNGQPGKPGAPFKKVAIGLEKKIQEFLVPLAKQRNYVMTNSREGRLLFWKSVTESTPVANLVQGVPPFSKIEPTFSPQEYYSDITGFTPSNRRHKGNDFTFANPWLRDVYRPISCKFDDTEKGDAPVSAQAKAGRMFAAIASWVIDDLPGWRDPQGELWQPNRTITVLAPDSMIYRPTELIIRNVKLRQSAQKEWTSLEVVLPGAFSGEIPKVLPWDEPS